jgi:chemotaxis protein MotA
MKQIDLATLIGVFAAFGLVFLSIHLGGGLHSFLDLNSLLIVLGGTLGATLVTFPLGDFKRSMPALKTAFFPNKSSVHKRISRILNIARRVRADSVESVSGDVAGESDTFFRHCLELLIDGQDEEEIRHILGIELDFLEDRHRRSSQLFQTMGTIAPAMGLIGTLIGLVQMLERLNDPSQIGPSMALALLTTFYGAIFANLIFLPLAGKLRSRSEEESLIKEMTIEGIAGVAQGVNPLIIERRLLGFLPPEQRLSEYD